MFLKGNSTTDHIQTLKLVVRLWIGNSVIGMIGRLCTAVKYQEIKEDTVIVDLDRNLPSGLISELHIIHPVNLVRKRENGLFMFILQRVKEAKEQSGYQK